jgi:hypothetical protein
MAQGYIAERLIFVFTYVVVDLMSHPVVQR